MAQLDFLSEQLLQSYLRKNQRSGTWLNRLLVPTRVAYLFIGVCLIIIASGFFLHRQYPDGVPHPSDWLGDLWQQIYSNLGIEVLSIAITVIVIERLNRRETERERKEELILQMGSPDQAFAVEAARRLRQKGWGFYHDTSLRDSSLKGANLQGADLTHVNFQSVILHDTNLQRAQLSFANLQGAFLVNANLESADLTGANLRGAHLIAANLQKAQIIEANLQDADLAHANLSGAALFDPNMKGVNLKGANLQGAQGTYNLQFDESTTLPDGTLWSPDRDLREFTDPDGWAAGKYKTDTPHAP